MHTYGGGSCLTSGYPAEDVKSLLSGQMSSAEAQKPVPRALTVGAEILVRRVLVSLGTNGSLVAPNGP